MTITAIRIKDTDSELKLKEITNISPLLKDTQKLKKCKICKEETSQEICKACELILKIKKI